MSTRHAARYWHELPKSLLLGPSRDPAFVCHLAYPYRPHGGAEHAYDAAAWKLHTGFAEEIQSLKEVYVGGHRRAAAQLRRLATVALLNHLKST